MVLSIRRWTSRFVFFVIFTILLFVVTGGYRWLADVVSPVHPYQEPRGRSLKVFVHDPDSPDGGNAADRLRWFYWYGE